MPNEITTANDIRDLEVTIRRARLWCEKEENAIVGTISIRASSEFQVNYGDLKLFWHVTSYGSSNENMIEVKAQYLADALEEIKRQRIRARQIAPLSLPRVVDDLPF